MSFPQSVADKVLIACGRHCALCHRFRGLKIELHHIKQKAAKGADTFDNCIPLCFDCHADMRSYDHKHPKGRKFSAAELEAHRDNWYQKFASSGGSVALPEHRELDRRMFLKVTSQLPYSEIISSLRNRYGGQSLLPGQLDPLDRYLDGCNDPSFEFLDADLEAARGELSESIEAYLDFVLNHVFVSDRDSRQLVIQPGMKNTDPDRYYPIVQEIARLENEVVSAYGILVKTGRRKLGVDPAQAVSNSAV